MKKIIITLVVILFAVSTFAVSNGETSGSFLLMPIGAKAFSLGNAMVTSSNEPLSIFYNPANVTSFTAASVSIGKTNYLVDTSMEYFAFCIPFTETDFFGLAVNVFFTEPIDAFTWGSWEESVEQFDVSYNQFFLTYGKKLGDNFSFAVAGKFYKEELANVLAETFLMDIGMKYKIGNGNVGLAISNLGSGLLYDRDVTGDYEVPTEKIPMNIVIGGNYKLIKGMDLSLQASIPSGNPAVISVGLEYVLFGAIPLRMGYSNVEIGSIGFGFGFDHTFQKTQGNRKVDILTLQFDYAYVPFGDLGETNHLGISLLFK